MFKKIAIASLLVAASSVALSQPTIYGRLDLGHNTTKTTTPTGVTKNTQAAGAENGATGSRLGFRGTEDLGGGLKAGFQYEFNIPSDNGTNTTTRAANLNMSGALGTITVGSQYNIFDRMVGSGANSILHKNRFSRAPSVSSDAISYQSPTVGGLTVGALMSSQDNTVNGVVQNGSSAATILNAQYKQGPLDVRVGVLTNGKTYTANGVHTKNSDNLVRIAYSMGPVTPYAIIGGNKSVSAAGTRKESGYELGTTVTVKQVVFNASIGDADAKVNGVTDTTVKGWKVGANYNFSKRTFAYAAVMSQQDKNQAGAQTRKVDQTRVGLVHFF
jgi:predicted porin